MPPDPALGGQPKRRPMNIAYVAHHEGETLEDTYRRADNGDEFAYPIPAELSDQLETAQNALDQAVTAVRRYIAEHDIQEIDLATGEAA